MTDPRRVADLLGHVRQAATEACAFAAGMDEAGFLDDRRTQQAVVMSLIVIGEAATRLMDEHPEFVAAHPQVPWRSMRGMRNRMAHGYFDINLAVVWETVQSALPALLQQIPEPPAAVD